MQGSYCAPMLCIPLEGILIRHWNGSSAPALAQGPGAGVTEAAAADEVHNREGERCSGGERGQC